MERHLFLYMDSIEMQTVQERDCDDDFTIE